MFTVTSRPATQDELDRCEVADVANVIDGSGAVLLDGTLIGLTNEYGTCVWVSSWVKPTDDRLIDPKGLIEAFHAAANDLI